MIAEAQALEALEEVKIQLVGVLRPSAYRRFLDRLEEASEMFSDQRERLWICGEGGHHRLLLALRCFVDAHRAPLPEQRLVGAHQWMVGAVVDPVFQNLGDLRRPGELDEVRPAQYPKNSLQVFRRNSQQRAKFQRVLQERRNRKRHVHENAHRIEQVAQMLVQKIALESLELDVQFLAPDKVLELALKICPSGGESRGSERALQTKHFDLLGEEFEDLEEREEMIFVQVRVWVAQGSR